MTVRITYRTPKIGEHEDGEANFQQQSFPELTIASDWIVMHIPETERSLIKMWIDDIPITGATLDATLRPLIVLTEPIEEPSAK